MIVMTVIVILITEIILIIIVIGFVLSKILMGGFGVADLTGLGCHLTDCHPNISRDILNTVLYTFPKVLTRRI